MQISLQQLRAIEAEIERHIVTGQSYVQSDITLDDQGPNMKGDLIVRFVVQTSGSPRGINKAFVVSIDGEHLKAA